MQEEKEDDEGGLAETLAHLFNHNGREAVGEIAETRDRIGVLFDLLRIDSNDDLTIIGPATIVATDMAMRSNAELTIDATNGPVEFFVLDDFVLDSNTLVASTTLTPADVTFNLLSDNIIDPNVNIDVDYVDFNSNAQLYGTIYAPNAAIDINSNFELF